MNCTFKYINRSESGGGMNFPNWSQDVIDTQILNPQDWIDSIGDSILGWLGKIGNAILDGITIFIIDGVAIGMFCYSVYCATMIMSCTKEEKFNEYTNKVMIAMVVYFCAKCATKLIGLE